MESHGCTIQLNDGELTLLIEALDSHEYWQLSDPSQRRDGYSTVEDGENEEIDSTQSHREA
jgi:hypothetical protein